VHGRTEGSSCPSGQVPAGNHPRPFGKTLDDRVECPECFDLVPSKPRLDTARDDGNPCCAASTAHDVDVVITKSRFGHGLIERPENGLDLARRTCLEFTPRDTFLQLNGRVFEFKFVTSCADNSHLVRSIDSNNLNANESSTKHNK
jgi:hypothetical protein